MKTILVMDDERSIVNAWKRILQFEGYRVVTASNGREGLVAANEENPDLIITDRSMPIMDGVEFCRQLKRELEFSRVPVVLTSAHNPRPGDTVIWDEFWLKPVSIEVLLASVRHLLTRDDA
ncbi:response regulator [Paraburkholderia strydomiana]|jgi:DNA-binding response OmpR family regulator|uniref:response regulator transcription factor n=1 Tax=Paraburkholderia strydomiana TaxID=1245417 RepID=UPI0038B9EF6B